MSTPTQILTQTDAKLAKTVKKLADRTMGAGGRLKADAKAGRELVALVKAAERAGDGRVVATLATKDLRDIIFYAAERGHVDFAEALLRAGVSPTLTEFGGLRPIVSAALGGHADVIAALVHAGEDPSYAGFFAAPVSIHAAGKGHLAAVRALVELGANVRARADVGGKTVLLDVARLTEADADLVRLIVERGADVNDADDDGVTPLMAAAGVGNLPVVRQLIRLGAEVNARRRLRRPDEIDRENRGTRLFDDKSLRKHRERMPDPLQTALVFAAREGHAEVVEVLLAAGGDPTARDADGHTAAEYAGRHGRVAVLAVLEGAPAGEAAAVVGVRDLLDAAAAGDLAGVRRALAAGVDVDGRVAVRYEGTIGETYRVVGGRPALVLAAERGDVPMVAELLNRGADIEARGDATMFDNGQSALHAAAERGHLEVVKALLAAGAKVNAKEQGRKGNIPGRTAMQIAIANKHRAVANELLRAGTAAAAGSANTKSSTAKPAKAAAKRAVKVTGLHEAAAAGNVSLVKRLIAAGADLNKPARAMSPLMHACFMGRWAVAQVLLDAGADVNLRNRYGSSALDDAVHGAQMAPDVRRTERPGRDYAKTVRLLLARGADASAVSPWDDRTPLARAQDKGLRQLATLLRRATTPSRKTAP